MTEYLVYKGIKNPPNSSAGMYGWEVVAKFSSEKAAIRRARDLKRQRHVATKVVRSPDFHQVWSSADKGIIVGRGRRDLEANLRRE